MLDGIVITFSDYSERHINQKEVRLLITVNVADSSFSERGFTDYSEHSVSLFA